MPEQKERSHKSMNKSFYGQPVYSSGHLKPRNVTSLVQHWGSVMYDIVSVVSFYLRTSY